jgi:hypothetical protein
VQENSLRFYLSMATLAVQIKESRKPTITKIAGPSVFFMVTADVR